MYHLPRVRDKVAFLRRLMEEFVGGRLSLEGDLSTCVFPENMVLVREEVGVLRRNTHWPRQDFIVLRLATDTVAPILKQVLKAGPKRAIIHVQIEEEGVLQLGAYDNFYPECVFTGPGVSLGLLAALQASGVLQDY